MHIEKQIEYSYQILRLKKVKTCKFISNECFLYTKSINSELCILQL